MQKYDDGFIKIYRKFLDWEWYDDVNTKVVFLHILLKANWKETRYHGEIIKEGELKTTVTEIANEVHLSVQNVKTALNHLKLTNELTIKAGSKFSIISIKNWGKYQLTNKQTNNQLTINQQSTNNQLTNSLSLYREEGKNNKNNKKRESGEAAAPSLDEIKAYFLDRNFKSDPQAFYFYYDSNNWTRHGQPIANWCSLAELWERREQERPTANIEDTNSSFEIDDLRQFGVLTEEII